MSGWQGAQSLHAAGGRAVVYTGMVDCFRGTVREEGMGALFKVLQPPLRHQAPAPLPPAASEARDKRERDVT